MRNEAELCLTLITGGKISIACDFKNLALEINFVSCTHPLTFLICAQNFPSVNFDKLRFFRLSSSLSSSNHTLTAHPDNSVNAIGRQHNHLPPIQIHANSLQYHSNASINKSFSNYRKPQMPSSDVAATFHFTRTA